MHIHDITCFYSWHDKCQDFISNLTNIAEANNDHDWNVVSLISTYVRICKKMRKITNTVTSLNSGKHKVFIAENVANCIW